MRNPRRLLAVMALALAGALALVACGEDDDGSGAAEPADLDFQVPTVDGGTFEGASLAGEPAVLWFWAPWCVTCAGEAPEVSALADDYAGQVNVVGVAGLDDSVEYMQEFIDTNGVDNIPHLADREAVVWQRFGISDQSSFVVLDAAGAVVTSGVLTPADVSDELAGLVS